MLPLANIRMQFSIEGETFEVEHFNINFNQPASGYKGRPEHEVLGGQITLIITQLATDNLYIWAKKETKLKSGSVLFQTDEGMTVLEVEFINAYCISLVGQTSAQSGASTLLVISPEKVKLNGIEHDNHW